MRYVLGTEPLEREPPRTSWVAHADYVMSRAYVRAIRPGDSVADVGAFKGGYTVLGAGAAGAKGEVTAFEPAAINYSGIERNIALNNLASRVTLCRKAVSDRNDFVPFFSFGPAAENSLYPAGVGASRWADGGVSSAMVETVSLDEYFAGRRDPAVVKVDTEGAEFAVLRGAERILASGAQFICELHPNAWEQAGHTGGDLVDWVAARGREVIDLRTMQPPGDDITYGPYLLRLLTDRGESPR